MQGTVQAMLILSKAGCWQLTLVILATWETEIRRIVVPGQPVQKKVRETPHLNRKKSYVVVQACHPSDSGKLKKGWRFRLAWAKSESLCLKQPEQKGMGAWLKW
jgi:hypothetical protein